ncbi:MAG TPA: hypothetical protein VM219_08995 [Phycisphaerae bacterium]|nr:hypothetical protein [Phycisphaerae bacterium]HUX02996.1 hypothetical protein [Phycisphaerae bacterium]
MKASELKNDPEMLTRAEARRLGIAPAAAMRFGAGEFVLGTNGEGAKTAPIKILARTGQPLYHWWWGRCVHDMAGMTVHKSRLALDYCHDDYEIIGYLNKFDTTGGDLNVSGAVVPYKENDRATEIMFKSRAGVPYEASIDFTPGDAALVIEDVPVGRKVAVNGYEFEGPGMVFRQWPLRGVAVCPYGADMNARSELARSEKNVPVTFIEPGKEHKMVVHKQVEAGGSETPVVDAETVVEPEAAPPAAVEGIVPAAAEGEEPPPAPAPEPAADPPVAPAEEPEPESEPEPEPEPEPESETPPVAGPETDAAAQARAECKRFVEAFGAKGGEWFADGRTFDEAQALHVEALVAENARQAKEIERLAKAARAARGEEAPVTFVADGAEDGPDVTGLSGKIGENAAKVAAGIKFQKKDN